MKAHIFQSAILVVAVQLTVAQTGFAQNRAGSLGQQTSQGAFGTSSQNRFGAGGQSALGQSAFGQGGQGGLQSGQNNRAGGAAGGRNQPQVGGQDGFVGSNADQIRNQFSNPRQRRRAMFDFAIESLNEIRESRRDRNSRNRKPPVRVTLRPLFQVSPRPAMEVQSAVTIKLQRAMPESSRTTRVSVSGTNATIEGAVSSEYDRKLAAKMLSLTPGVHRVENRLTIEPNLQTQ